MKPPLILDPCNGVWKWSWETGGRAASLDKDLINEIWIQGRSKDRESISKRTIPSCQERNLREGWDVFILARFYYYNITVVLYSWSVLLSGLPQRQFPFSKFQSYLPCLCKESRWSATRDFNILIQKWPRKTCILWGWSSQPNCKVHSSC